MRVIPRLRGVQEHLPGLTALTQDGKMGDMELTLSYRCSRCYVRAHQLCSRCRVAIYCSKECQNADFEDHRQSCRDVRVARVKVQDKELEMRYCHPELFPTAKGSHRDVFSFCKVKLGLQAPTKEYIYARVELFETLLKVNTRNTLTTAVSQVLEMKPQCSQEALELFRELPYVCLRIGSVPAIKKAHRALMVSFCYDLGI